MQDTDDPVVQAQTLITEARQQFAADVDGILAGLSRELRQAILARFGEYLPMRRLADVVLLQLVREAFELLNDADTRLDLRDWTRQAKKVLGEKAETT